ncbi:ABC transporter permease subunit [Rhodococcus hoagii]|nr:ABC transporter permease subunit [Prescottella equi]
MARRRRRWSGILLAAPMTAYVAVFFIAPLVLLAVYSVMKFDLLTFQVRSGFTLENYRELFSGTYVGAVLRSLAMTLVMTAVCVVLGFPVALTIARASGRTKALLLVAVIVPYWISFVVRTYAWLELLSPTGVVSKVAAFFGIVPEGAQLGYSTFAIGVGMVAGYLPLMILPMFMALDRIDPALHEAAADMGLSRRRAFWKVTAKLAMPGSIAGVLLVGIPATGEYTIPAILGGSKTLMVGNVEAEQFLATGNYPFGAAIATTLMVVMLAVLFASRKRLDRLGTSHEAPGQPRGGCDGCRPRLPLSAHRHGDRQRVQRRREPRRLGWRDTRVDHRSVRPTSGCVRTSSQLSDRVAVHRGRGRSLVGRGDGGLPPAQASGRGVADPHLRPAHDPRGRHRRGNPGGHPASGAQHRYVVGSGRTHRVLFRLRHIGAPVALRDPDGYVRRGRGGYGCPAAPGLPEGAVADDDARGRHRRAAVLHVLVRRRRQHRLLAGPETETLPVLILSLSRHGTSRRSTRSPSPSCSSRSS